MNKLNLVFFGVFLFISSCKGQEKNEPSFERHEENEVNIKVNSGTKHSLEYLANNPIKIISYCGANMDREYTVDFYFHINQEVKELIVIEYFSNPCEKGNLNVNRKIQKSIIPIQKIGSIDIENFTPTYVDPSNKNIRKLFINMEYNSKSIIQEYTESRGFSENKFHSDTIKENTVILDIPKENVEGLKKAIDYLVTEFK